MWSDRQMIVSKTAPKHPVTRGSYRPRNIGPSKLVQMQFIKRAWNADDKTYQIAKIDEISKNPHQIFITPIQAKQCRGAAEDWAHCFVPQRSNDKIEIRSEASQSNFPKCFEISNCLWPIKEKFGPEPTNDLASFPLPDEWVLKNEVNITPTVVNDLSRHPKVRR